MSDKESDDLRAKLMARKPKKVDSKRLLSSGSTLINLAATGRPNGCFIKGKYHFFVGDSDSGKTWLCLQLFAEACISKRFNNYRLIYDASEGGALMDIGHFFGDAVMERMEPPARDADGEPRFSEYIEDMYDNIEEAHKVWKETGKPFIYVEDSMDALGSLADEEKQEAQKKARRAGKEVPGTFGDGKAKYNSRYLRKVCSMLEKSGSMLIIISQTRDNINPMSMEKKTRAGGKALKFYATLEMWTSSKGAIVKSVRGKNRKVGNTMLVRVKKNRAAGRDRVVQVPIYNSYGVDDVGANIDYLIEEKHWTKGPKGIRAKEFGADEKTPLILSREALIKYVEENGLESELATIVAQVWNDIEDQCALRRKPRYAKQSE